MNRLPSHAEAVVIRFGTNGWRGIIGEDFTQARVGCAVRAIGEWFSETQRGGEVLLAHDRRLGGVRLVAQAVPILAACGLSVRPVCGAVPTPAVTRAVRRRGAAGALVFTASHNPPTYHGLKVFDASGTALSRSAAAAIEARLLGALNSTPVPSTDRRTVFAAVDVRQSYCDELFAWLRPECFRRRSPLHVTYDALHGAGAGVLDSVLTRAGVCVRVLRAERDVRFGGGAPEPSGVTLLPLLHELRGAALGLATDGDADRFALVTPQNGLVSEAEALALLFDSLAVSGRLARGNGVALSHACGSFPQRVVEEHGLLVQRVGIGFQKLSRLLERGEAQVAGDESGGFALAPFALDKDGLLAACLLVQAAAEENLDARLRVLRKRIGRTYCERGAIAGTIIAMARLETLRASPPVEVAGQRVCEARGDDGLWLGFRDGFLLLRRSGTEPLIRLYAEAATRQELRARLRAAVQLLS